jgi:hypothetical protein
LLALLTIVLLSLGAVACGGVGKSTGSASQNSSDAFSTGDTTPTTASNTKPTSSNVTPAGAHGKDSNDGDDDPNVDDDISIVDYGHAASGADKLAIAVLIERYYAAAAADDGAKACSQIYSVVVEMIPEDFSQAPGLGGKTCAVVMSKVFKQRHQQMAADVAALKVTRVRVEGNKGLASTYFGKLPQPYVMVHRDNGAWKMESLFEIVLP